MIEQDVQNWLNEYGRAWVDGDPDRVVTLFSNTATYRETPFDEPMRGRREIREYWQNGAADAQENVEFASQVWADASAVPKMRVPGRSEDVIFFDGVFFEPSLKPIFFVS